MRVRIVQSEDPSPEAVSPETFGAARDTFEVAARTNVGRTRTNNEDNFTVAPELGLFVLSDGMGGEAAGELASKIAVEEILRHMKEVDRDGSLTLLGDANAQFSELTNRLASAVRRSNRVIWEAAQQHASQRGMGATVVAALLRAPVLSMAHVGDSRIYLHRAGELQQLTEDHSLVMEQVRRGLITKEEAERSEMQNILVRALGAEEAVTVEMDEVFLMPGDQILLCSDGLTRMVEDSGIATVLTESSTLQEACDRLVQKANENGGEDNITVVMVRVREAPPKGFWSWLKSLFS